MREKAERTEERGKRRACEFVNFLSDVCRRLVLILLAQTLERNCNAAHTS